VSTCLNPQLHGSISVGQRCACGFESPAGMPHDFVTLLVTGNASESKDTISQCAWCNLVRHDYEYDGGKRSPNYPTHHLHGRGAVDRGCTRGDMAEERAAAAAAGPSSGAAGDDVWLRAFGSPPSERQRQFIAAVRRETIDACVAKVRQVERAWAPSMPATGFASECIAALKGGETR
jgi:hypothetical protein